MYIGFPDNGIQYIRNNEYTGVEPFTNKIAGVMRHTGKSVASKFLLENHETRYRVPSFMVFDL